ncbi:MAG: hypothetical protein EA416_08765 [Trueperaceae bacterium]|jgi:hypothetical protein|nr:MAG: hypothetical protein EA416_08765 [Trueperaceae bacterium]
MMPNMIEDGVDAFIARFSAQAASVEVASRVEGSPLLECLTDDAVLYLLERTGPYVVSRGRARVIVQPETATLVRLDPDDLGPLRHLESLGVGVLVASGVVRSLDTPFVVVDAGVPLVVAADVAPDDLALGDRVRFQSRAPVHGFVLAPKRDRESVRTDDLV